MNKQALLDLVAKSGRLSKQNSRSWIFDCPLCNKKDKLFMLKESGHFVCWTCRVTQGFAGRPEFAFVEMVGLPLSEIKALLYGDQKFRSPLHIHFNPRDFYGDDDDFDEDAGVLQEMAYPYDFYPLDHKFAARGLKYLTEERGISLELAREYRLRYCPSTRRIIFPIEIEGKCYGWQARAVFQTDGFDEETGAEFHAPKILTPKGVQREWMWMFQDRLQGAKHAVVLEGPVDGIKAHLIGGNIVSMGKIISPTQLSILKNSGVEKIFLGLDPDAAREAAEITRKLGVPTFDLRPPPGALSWDGKKPAKDLGDMSPEGVLAASLVAPERGCKLYSYVESDFEKLQRQMLLFRSSQTSRSRRRPGR